MATGTLKLSSNYLNNYEYYHNMLRGNPAFREDDWNNAYKTDTLPQLISMITDKNRPTLQQLNNEYGYDFLDGERRQIALYNELYADRNAVLTVTENYLDDNNIEQARTYETTEYNHTKKLLQQYRDIELDNLKLQKQMEAKEEMNTFAKLGMSALSIPANVLGGVLNFAGGIANLAESIFDGATSLVKEGNFDKGFRAAFNDNDLDFADEYQRWLAEWEMNASYIRDVNGEYSFIGKILAGVSTSIGEMLPTVALSMVSSGILNTWANRGEITSAQASAIASNVGKAAHAIYYTGMSSNSFKEASAELPTVPTMKLVINTAAKTAAEVLIEKMLAQGFGPSNLDKLHFNYAPKGASKFVTQTVLGSFAKDFIEEGVEELLQEFSGYLIDRVFTLSDENFGQLSDWNFQTMLDSFIIGGLATIAFNAADIISTNRVLLSDTSYDKTGKLKLSKSKSWLYKRNLSDLFTTYESIVNDKSMTDSQRKAAVGQMYVSYRTISSVFGEIGKDRFKAATKMLETINKTNNYQTLNAPLTEDYGTAKYRNDTKAFANILINSIPSLSSEYAKELASKTKSKSINTIIHRSDDKSKLKNKSENVKKTVDNVFKLNPEVKNLVLTNEGTSADEKGDTMVLSVDLADNADAETVYKIIAEQTLQDMLLADKTFSPVLKEFSKIYSEYFNVENPDNKDVLLHTLFDDNFYRTLIYNSNKDAVKFLVKMSDIVDSVQAKNGKDAIFKNSTSQNIKNIKTHLIDYCINQQEIVVDDIKVLSPVEKRYILNKRYSKDLANRITKSGPLNISAEELEIINNRINNAPISEEEKGELLKDIVSDDSRTREGALEMLDEYYQDKFYGPYNGVIYNVGYTVGETIFNNFMIDAGLTLETLYDTTKYSDTMLEEMGDLSPQEYIAEKFDIYTSGNYSITNKGVVRNIKTSAEEFAVIKTEKSKLPAVAAFDISLFDNILVEDIPVSLKQYLSLEDLIYNGAKYFSIERLRKDTNISNVSEKQLEDPLQTYRLLAEYVNKKSKNKMGITLTMNNIPIMIRYDYDNSIFNKNVDGKLTQLLKSKDKNFTIPITDIVPEIYLTDYLADIKVAAFKNSDINYFGHRIRENNTIYINTTALLALTKPSMSKDSIVNDIGKRTLNEAKNTILHELHHAMFEESGVGSGYVDYNLTDEVVNDLFNNVDGLKQSIDADMTLRDAKVSKNAISKELSKFLYNRVSGEVNAEGNILYAWPFVNNDKLQAIITPWGSVYVTDGKNVYIDKDIDVPTNISARKKAQEEINKIRSTKAKQRKRGQFRTPADYSHTRRVSAKEAKGTLLEKYIDKQLSDKVKNTIINFDIDKVDKGVKGRAGRKLYSLIQTGNLTREGQLLDILRDFNDTQVDQYTFDLINDTYFKNPNIKNMKALVLLSDRYIKELWIVKSTLLRYDKENGTNFSEDLLTRAPVSQMLALVEKVRNGSKTKEYYEYYSKRAELAFDPKTKQEYALDISSRYLRIATMETFDGTIDSAAHSFEKGRFVASRNYNTSDYKSAMSLQMSTNDGDTTLLEAIADPYADEGFNKLVAPMDDMINDLTVYLLERFNVDNPKATTSEIVAYQNKLYDQLNDMPLDELTTMWRNSIVSKYAGEYASDRLLTYKPTRVRTHNQIRNNTNSIKNKILKSVNSALANKRFKNRFVKQYSKYFEFDDSGTIVFKSTSKHLRTDLLVELEQILQNAWKTIQSGEYFKNKQNKSTTRLEQKVESMSKTIAALEEELNTYKQKFVKLQSAEFNISFADNEYVENIPESLERILSFSFTKFAPSKVKFASEDNMVINGKIFFEENSELLSVLTADEIADIINFYKYSTFNEARSDANTARKYEAFRMYILGHFADLHNDPNSGVKLTDEQYNDIKDILQKATRIYATGLSIANSILRKIEPEQIIAKRLLKLTGVEMTEEEVTQLLYKINTTDFGSKNSVDNLVKEFDFYYSLALKKSKRPDVFDRFWRFQRMAMLSSPGTWVRNITSNYFVSIGNKFSEHIGEFFTSKLKNGKIINGQWQITNIQIDKPIEDYVNAVFVDSGLIDMLSVNTKYDIASNKNAKTSEILSNMIISSLNSKLFNEQQFKVEIFNKASQFIYKMLDDSPWVKKHTLRYFTSMLQQYYDEYMHTIFEQEAELKSQMKALDVSDDLRKSDIKKWKANNSKMQSLNAKLTKLNLRKYILDTSNISNEILDMFADAYTLASYDYMHRGNMFGHIERTLHKRFGSFGYLLYKQILPFAGSSWNWAIEGLKYTPMGLVKAIYDFNNLEKTIDKRKEKIKQGENLPSEKFVQYMVKRDIGKGVLGSIGFGIGIILMALGLIGVDEEDDKVKITIGDIYIDISDIFGTNSIFLGATLFASIEKIVKKENTNIGDFVASILDQMLLDNTFSDLFNTFRYDDTIGQWVVNHTDDSFSMLIANFVKTINSSMYIYQAQYNKGLLGILERLSGYIVPGLLYAYPTRYDPYTGEKQSKYAWPFVIDMFNRVSPVKISYYKVSDLEKTALKYGVRKGELTGNYEDVGQLNAAEVSKLNEYYGKLNSESLEKLFNSKVKYKVWNEAKGKYETIAYSKMNDEQKKSVIERVMDNNARYAKMYVLTNAGYKYYGTESEILEAKQLGIKNVYIETTKKKGYVK